MSKKTETQNRTFLQELLNTVLYILFLFLLFFGIRYFLFAPVSVDGASMEPTLHHEDRLILNKVSSIERFDIVVFPAPDDLEHQYIKRVIGVPGDEIVFDSNTLLVNGEEIPETYLQNDEKIYEDWNDSLYFDLEMLTGATTVPDESYFVMGDNRNNSKDSRSFGFVSQDAIIGETQWRFWPLDKFGNVLNN
ncbi:signal peptidase I [Lacticigenium naphthae]|uniref:signal peptidase I n=1 Tax=Lacticigenium naphthae TaxID=515351 RepID=UPI000419B8CA|nr:signal peptidase I [Lacticigenium naphthae]